jgi:hypothetical protein
MSAILTSAMFSAAKTTTVFATPPSSYQKRKSFRPSSSSRLSRRNKSPQASSKVAIGSLPLASSTEEESSDGSNGLMLECVPHQKGDPRTHTESEHWNSFHKRFGNKPRNKGRRKNLKDFFRRTTKKQDSQADGLWSSVVDAMWECTHPAVGDRDEDDEWFDEIPFQRDGYLDIRQENGKWHFVEEASSDLDLHLME